jgi:2,3-bisphosphoglycerate-independent phosphoglycerate mutase
MSAHGIKEAIVQHIQKDKPDFICLNFANPDMVGHTGDFEAVIKAIETVDECLKAVVETAKAHEYAIIIIADHGNADMMINEDGSPNTAHTTNPVPIIAVNTLQKAIKSGILADVAPSILDLMGIAQPEAMTGKSLFK